MNLDEFYFLFCSKNYENTVLLCWTIDQTAAYAPDRASTAYNTMILSILSQSWLCLKVYFA